MNVGQYAIDAKAFADSFPGAKPYDGTAATARQVSDEAARVLAMQRANFGNMTNPVFAEAINNPKINNAFFGRYLSNYEVTELQRFGGTDSLLKAAGFRQRSEFDKDIAKATAITAVAALIASNIPPRPPAAYDPIAAAVIQNAAQAVRIRSENDAAYNAEQSRIATIQAASRQESEAFLIRGIEATRLSNISAEELRLASIKAELDGNNQLLKLYEQSNTWESQKAANDLRKAMADQARSQAEIKAANDYAAMTNAQREAAKAAALKAAKLAIEAQAAQAAATKAEAQKVANAAYPTTAAYIQAATNLDPEFYRLYAVRYGDKASKELLEANKKAAERDAKTLAEWAQRAKDAAEANVRAQQALKAAQDEITRQQVEYDAKNGTNSVPKLPTAVIERSNSVNTNLVKAVDAAREAVVASETARGIKPVAKPLVSSATFTAGIDKAANIKGQAELTAAARAAAVAAGLSAEDTKALMSTVSKAISKSKGKKQPAKLKAKSKASNKVLPKLKKKK